MCLFIIMSISVKRQHELWCTVRDMCLSKCQICIIIYIITNRLKECTVEQHNVRELCGQPLQVCSSSELWDSHSWCVPPVHPVDNHFCRVTPANSVDSQSWCVRPENSVDIHFCRVSPTKSVDNQSWCVPPLNSVDNHF